MAVKCVFCAIAAGEAAAAVVYEDDQVLFFRDIRPKAPVHLVGIPRRHAVSLASVQAADAPLLGALLAAVPAAARRAGIGPGGFRLISNAGRHAGQEVGHLHVHVLGGEPLGPMRC